ncbi:bacterial regulatory helix-turn-helix, lysR family protein [Paraburkholderia xenovorans LB400]|uniref:Transcriptional regulator, LysR family n=1 Tax=Paraburkholderia xenovorans (strain LB400) TaxID=266265 RepID=Q13FE8_PARXL|nr:LysR family transcriptional regulator [Paraburkholderia xenovorans]ABE37191.1 transcriptional regulator, LysR family [Paraburkholderia xenovorans LB400]AIP35059.1 bacterial regulatory helix-turn-helix, lysR family protein [Paraburkholderia xenovorans LB400]
MFDWENVRHFLAVARIGTLSGAARSLKVDHATVSRRLSALEDEIKTRLIERLPRACKLTLIGQRVFELAQGMEEDAYAIERFVDASRSPLSGKVSLSAPPVLVAHFLAKHLADFRRVHPGVQLSVSGEARQISLSRREADVALRLVRPEEGTSVVRKLGRMSFDLYASRDYPHLHNPSAWEFISYDAGFTDMPQQKWLMSVARGRPIACEISDINGHLAATQAGAGVAGLPDFLADTDAKLQRVAYDGEPFSRDIWLAVHRDLRRSPHVRAVMDFLLKIVKENPAFTISG